MSKKYFKALSVATLAAMMTTIAAPAFAATGDFFDKTNQVPYNAADYRTDVTAFNALLEALDARPGEFVFENGGKGYNYDKMLTAIQEGMEAGKSVTEAFLDAKADPANSEELPAAVVTVKSVSAINSTSVKVTFSDGTVANVTLTTPLVNGATKVTFTYNGVTYTNQALDSAYVAPGTGALQVQSVNAINYRQIEVKFNNAVDETTATNLDNYYIKLVDETTGAISTNAISTLGGVDWEAVLSEDGKTVTIQSVANGGGAEDLFDLNLVENEQYYIQVRNVKDAEDNFTDVQEKGQLLNDTLRPVMTLDETNVENTSDLVLNFSEPIKPGASIYVDGNILTANYTDVTGNGTVAADSTITVDITSTGLALTNGSHKIAVVGAKDLNDNTLTPNPTELSFTVVDPTTTKAPKPVVTSVQQVADNAFKVIFSTTDVKPVTTAGTEKVVTVKAGAYAAGAYADIDEVSSDVVATAAAVTGFDQIVTTEVDTDDDGEMDHTEWLVILNGNATEAAGELSYRNANVMTKNIVVDNFYNDNGTGSTADDTAGSATTKSLVFKKDVTAPIIAAQDAVTSANDTLTVLFSDAPFTTNGAGDINLVPATVEVKYVDKNGVTHVELAGASTTADPDLTGRAVDIQITDTNMLTAGGDLIPGGTYSIKLLDGDVTDDAEAVGAASYELLDGTHPFVEKTISYTVPGEEDPVTGVPQTTKGMINSFEEINAAGNPYTIAVKAALTNLKANQIVVQFDGDVDGTKITTSNFKLNNTSLPSGSVAEYFESNIDGVAGNDKYVIVTLPKEVIKYTGSYDFDVMNVANKVGNKMLPVSDTLDMTDNTAPIAQSITVNSSNTVTLTFSENVNLFDVDGGGIGVGDIAAAANNFKVTANGKTLAVTNIVDLGTNKITLTLADNFDNAGDLNVPVTLMVKKDSNGNMFVIDDSEGNKAKEVTVTK